jgi:putative ABC transport system substrate-binding protein
MSQGSAMSSPAAHACRTRRDRPRRRTRVRVARVLGAALFAGVLAIATLASAGPARAGTVLLLRSRATRAYDEATLGMRRVYRGAIVELTLEGDSGAIERRVTALQPDVIVALGARAAGFARERCARVPLVYAFVPDPARLDLEGERITGVSTEVPAEAEILGLRSVAPSVRRIGVVFGPQSSGRFLREARSAVAREGCTLVEIPVGGPAELGARARASIDRVDGLWLPADASVASREAFRFLLDLSLEHRKPLLVFAEPLVRSGALVAVCPDFTRAGERIAETVRRIEAGERAGDIPVQRLDRTRLVVNQATARALGLALPADAMRRAEVLP